MAPIKRDRSSGLDILSYWSTKLAHNVSYVNLKHWVDNFFLRNGLSIILLCRLHAASYQENKQCMENVIKHGEAKKFGFIDESWVWQCIYWLWVIFFAQFELIKFGSHISTTASSGIADDSKTYLIEMLWITTPLQKKADNDCPTVEYDKLCH